MVGLYFYIFLWSIFYKVSCISLILTFIPLFFMYKYDFLYRMRKKECFANCFLDKNSWLYLFFTRKLFVILGSIIFLLIMTVSLFFSFIFFDNIQKLVLFIDIFILYFIYKRVKFEFLNAEIKEIFKINVVSTINAGLLLVIFLLIALLSPVPNFVANDLSVTLTNYSSNFNDIHCYYFKALIKYLADFYAFSWWLFSNMFVNIIHTYLIKIILTIIFLTGGWFVFYAYSRFLLILMNFLKDFKNGK